MTTNKIQSSFASGELSPQLYARVDLAKYHTGLGLCRNFFVDYRGGVTTRAGTEFMLPCLSNANIRLIPFQFNTQQTYMLEFGQNYMRVIANGAYVTEPQKLIVGIDTPGNSVLVEVTGHAYSTGDMIYFDQILGTSRLSGMIYSIEVTSPDHFLVKDQFGNPFNDFTRFEPYVSNGYVARVYKLVTPWTSAQLPALKYTQSADVLTLTHPEQPAYDLTRSQHWVWTLSEILPDAAILPPTTVAGTPSAAGTIYYAYVVTAVDALGNESVQSERCDVTLAVNIAATAGNIALGWAPAANAIRYKVYKATPSSGIAVPGGPQFGYVGSVRGLLFVDTNITPDFAITPPSHINPFAKGAIENVVVGAGGSGYLPTSKITLTDASGTGAQLRPIVSSGAVVAVQILNGGRGYTAPSITVSDGTLATFTTTLTPTTGNFPSVSAYFQQRKVYAGSYNYPQRFWMSQPGLYKNFSKSNPIKADDAIQGDLVSQQVNDIKWLIPMQSGLITLTGGSAWQLSAGGAGSALTPTTVAAQPQAFGGAADIKPLVVNFDILYVQSLGSVVRDLSYNFFANVYTGADITVLSNHLFFGKKLTSWCWAQEPYKIVWITRDDGKMLSLTYLKEQEINGWAWHDTNGSFVTVESITEGDETVVYMVVRRLLFGTLKNLVERMASRTWERVEDAWCLDCALLYEGTATDTFVGLDHLDGSAVTVLADGNMFTGIPVAGALTLPVAATKVLVGLPFTAEGRTLRLDTGDPTVQGKRKKISAASVRVDSTRGLELGSGENTLMPMKERATEPYNAPVGLHSHDQRLVLDPNWTSAGVVQWRQAGPFPATVLGVILEYVVGDDDR